MTLTIEPEPIPLTINAEGVVRVSGTRIPIDRIVWAFNHGETPEEIVRGFDTLHLADVYSVIGYYLRHRSAVDAHIEEQERIAASWRRKIEADPRHQAFHQRFLEMLKDAAIPPA
ncbi:MAG: DUF433 domain-containing protein [Dehalococcoidia bacterium]